MWWPRGKTFLLAALWPRNLDIGGCLLSRESTAVARRLAYCPIFSTAKQEIPGYNGAMDASTKKPAKPRRRWLRFSLRTLLILVSVVALILGYSVVVLEYARVVNNWGFRTLHFFVAAIPVLVIIMLNVMELIEGHRF